MVTPNQPPGTPSPARGGDLPPIVRRVAAFIRDAQSEDFDHLALDVLAFQQEQNPSFGSLFPEKGKGGINHWSQAPWVPTEAFRHYALTTAPALRVFHTSGTSGAGAGKHHLPDTGLYDLAWREPFRRHLIPNRETMPVLSLIPGERQQPHSSLSYMVSRILEACGDPETSRVFVEDNNLQANRLEKTLARHTGRQEPVLLLGTAFSMVHFLDFLGSRRLRLPTGSRLMDTGGFKGRSREVERPELLKLYEEKLGIPNSHVVGEYGMTELSSQFYETTLSEFHIGRPPKRVYAAPHWVRTRILDPATLTPQKPGSPGLLAHFDLANAWTVSPVLTGDLGMEAEGGFVVLGRAPGTELRGCSLTSEFLETTP